jgi:hypothetical protein
MKKNIIPILAILVAVLPFLGFPSSFKAPVFFLLGASIAFLSFREHHHKRKTATVRRIRRAKEVVTVHVNNTLEKQSGGSLTITNLVEPDDKK